MKISVYFVLDRRSAYKAAKSIPILCDVKYWIGDVQKHFRFSTKTSCTRRGFKNQKFTAGVSNSEELNKKLTNIRDAVIEIHTESYNKGLLPDTKEFRLKVLARLNDVEVEKTLVDSFQDYINSIEAKKRSRSFVSGMKNLLIILKEVRDKHNIGLMFENITANFETNLLKILNERYSENTVGAYVKRLKIFMNWAAKQNLHQNYNYKNFEIKEEAREIVALTELEVQLISKLNLPSHSHIHHGGTRLIRDWFIFSTQTSLRYSDLKNYNLEQTEGGYNLRVLKTQKTKVEVVIPVTKILYNILEQYDFVLPPPPTNQKFNLGLERIAQLAKIEKKISSKAGRKTFCTTMYLKGIPVPRIMKISGHKTEKEFYKYIGVTLTENAALVRSMNPDMQIEHKHKKMAIG